MDKSAESISAFADDVGGWEVLAGFAISGFVFGFAFWTKVLVGVNYVFFTAVAKYTP